MGQCDLSWGSREAVSSLRLLTAGKEVSFVTKTAAEEEALCVPLLSIKNTLVKVVQHVLEVDNPT